MKIAQNLLGDLSRFWHRDEFGCGRRKLRLPHDQLHRLLHKLIKRCKNEKSKIVG